VVDGGVGLERGQLVHARGVGLERGQLAVEHRHEQLTEDDRVASAPASPAIAVLQGRRVSLLLVLNPKSGRQHFESRFGLEMLLGKVGSCSSNNNSLLVWRFAQLWKSLDSAQLGSPVWLG
jgi:hypothetical protein